MIITVCENEFNFFHSRNNMKSISLQLTEKLNRRRALTNSSPNIFLILSRSLLIPIIKKVVIVSYGLQT